MQRDPAVSLHDIITAARVIQSVLGNISLEDYRDNLLVRNTVERQFMIVGEALGRLCHADPAYTQRVTDCSRIIAFRHRLAHGYDTTNDVIVWTIARDELPVLLNECMRLLTELDPDAGSAPA